MTFMIAAYIVFWLATFIFIFTIYSRQRSLQHDLELVEELLEDQDKRDQG